MIFVNCSDMNDARFQQFTYEVIFVQGVSTNRKMLQLHVVMVCIELLRYNARYIGFKRE
jgi:hypothetical protein